MPLSNSPVAGRPAVTRPNDPPRRQVDTGVSWPRPLGESANRPVRVAIVILHFNRAGDVIDSLRRMATLRERHEIVVVDNGSRPECVAELRAAPEMAGVRLLALAHNIGSCAWDFGAYEAGADVAIKLDDDSHIEATSLAVIEERFASEPDLGALALAIEGGPFPCRDRPSFRRGTAVGFIGCGVAIRIDALRHAGGHDPNFFIYADEWDLSMRLLNAGYEIDRAAEVRVVHRTAQSSGRTSPRLVAYTVRNEVLMARKYFSALAARRLLLRIIVWNLHRFWPTSGWRTLGYVVQGLFLGRFDRRVAPVPLREPVPMLARYEAWYGAFRPLWRHRADLILPPGWWLRLSRFVRGLLASGPRERVVIFGASRGGIKTYRHLSLRTRPVFFVDNDPGKHGRRLLGLTIRPPADLGQGDNYDRIIVGSLYSPEIMEQLDALGVARDRVFAVDQALLEGSWIAAPTAGAGAARPR